MVQPTRREDSGREVIEASWMGAPARYLAGRLIVKFRQTPAETAESVDAMARRAMDDLPQGRMVGAPGRTGRVVYDIDQSADLAQVAETMSGRDDVEYAEPDIIDHAALIPNDPRLVDQWSPAKVNAYGAWDLETGTTGVVIGIIDSGISMSGNALDHPELSDSNRIVLGTDFVDGGTPQDANGHGTHVAGIAAAVGNNSVGVAGMNWGSRLYICRTLDANGDGTSSGFADAVEEIVDYALANSLKAVINYSAGGGANQTKLDACNYASSNGMLLCAATGNDNAGPVIWPAAYSTTVTGVVAVGSTNPDDTVSDFSNVGPEVTVVAPGRDILSTMPTYQVTLTPGVGLTYGRLDGTSMATPLVTGLAALMWSRHPTFTNEKIKDCLTSTAVKLGAGDFDNSWGHGRVDAEAAVRCGDVIQPPTFIGPSCPPSIVPVLCPSRIFVQCPSRVPPVCPSRVTPLCPSQVAPRCPSQVAQLCVTDFPRCPTQVPALCPPSQVAPLCPSEVGPRCPSRLPVLCPTSLVPVQCPSRLPVLCPTTLVPPICARPTAVSGGGQVEAPSAGRPGPREVWYDQENQYFWVDDQGRTHPFSPGAADAGAEAGGAAWYWVDDEGGTHYWTAGGSGGR